MESGRDSRGERQSLDFVGSHILSVGQFSRADVERLFTVADSMEPYVTRHRTSRALQGAILANLFFEPSTRTRISFGTAFNRLGGSVRETSEIGSLSVVKGESLADSARVISGYGDVIVIRHPVEGSVAEFAAASRVPVVNAGDGANEHPTQALLDLYTIRREVQARGSGIDGVRIAVIGDLKHGRAVHSLLKMLRLFDAVQVHLVSPPGLELPEDILVAVLERGFTTRTVHSLPDGIQNVDVCYVTRTQEERFSSVEEAQRHRGLLRLDKATYSRYCEPHTVIMHPLPRDSRLEAGELSDDLDTHPNLAAFRQADNGVAIRMALFALVLGVEKDMHAHSLPSVWFRSMQSTGST